MLRRRVAVYRNGGFTMNNHNHTCPVESHTCIHCGADSNHIRLLNTRAEFNGGVANFYYRCGECKKYFKSCWFNDNLLSVMAS